MRKAKGKVKSEGLAKRQRRKLKIRKTIIGSSERPRVCAVKSNKHISVQVINDSESKTLASVNTFGKNAIPEAKGNVEGAKKVGAALAGKLKEQNITQVVFDRSGFKYTGVIAAVAESLRENGIQV
jgi:large subunit ribosomal protein L18